jgi:restriction system protein
MPIPGFQSIMLPLLQHLADGAERANQETLQAMRGRFALTDEEFQQMLPSGQQTMFTNRVAWAKSYLKRAGLIESPTRGVYRISEAGRRVLLNPPNEIKIPFLAQFEAFAGFRSPSGPSASAPNSDETETPEEQLEEAYRLFREGLASEILARLKDCTPRRFEEIVVRVLKGMGYGGSRADSAEVLGGSGDGGVDGVLREDWLGLEKIYVQAKRWAGTVGRPTVQQFAGALHGQKARKGVLITTSTFSQDAIDYIDMIDTRIVLIDGPQLAEYMIDTGIGVTEAQVYRTHRIDSDTFSEDASAVAT